MFHEHNILAFLSVNVNERFSFFLDFSSCVICTSSKLTFFLLVLVSVFLLCQASVELLSFKSGALKQSFLTHVPPQKRCHNV